MNTNQGRNKANRIILHIDFNSFFASIEQQANPFLRGKAIAVAGKGYQSINDIQPQGTRKQVKHMRLQRTVVTTASKEAKALGVKTAMSSVEAKQICPELIIIPGDPQKYSEITSRFLKILNQFSESVEQFSTDEAFADITTAARDYLGATFIAERIRWEIRKTCGASCTVSIGIAPNKLAAKLACESTKPSGLTIVQPNKLKQFVQTQPLQAICGISPRIDQRLQKLGITSTAALQKTPLHILIKEFKTHYGLFLFNAARGIGSNHVSSIKPLPKSVGHSYTFPFNLQTFQEIRTNLLALCDRIAARMRKKGLIGTCLSIYARGQGLSTGTIRRLKTPLNDGLEVYEHA